MKIRSYEDRDSAAWDALVEEAPNATFLHSRRFLAYHGNRFADASLVLEAGGDLHAVMPAAIDPQNTRHVVSHPGATYGGLIAPGFSASRTMEVLAGMAKHYRERGFTDLTYKTVPYHLSRTPSEGDRYALWRLGAKLVRRDLWSVVPLAQPNGVTNKLRRDLQVADRCGLIVSTADCDDDYRRYHRLLSANLGDRHGVAPVHTADELIDLRQRLGEGTALWLVHGDDHDAPIAGVWLFRFGKVAWHMQYTAANAEAREKRAMHLLFQRLLTEARDAGVTHLSYGAVTEQGGRVLNPGLERFKAVFGGGLVTHDFFSLALDQNWPSVQVIQVSDD